MNNIIFTQSITVILEYCSTSGLYLTFKSGSACCRYHPVTAWPASWYATVLFSSGANTFVFFSSPRCCVRSNYNETHLLITGDSSCTTERIKEYIDMRWWKIRKRQSECTIFVSQISTANSWVNVTQIGRKQRDVVQTNRVILLDTNITILTKYLSYTVLV